MAPIPRTKWTRRVPDPVLIGGAYPGGRCAKAARVWGSVGVAQASRVLEMMTSSGVGPVHSLPPPLPTVAPTRVPTVHTDRHRARARGPRAASGLAEAVT